jgi:hypothetical protein
VRTILLIKECQKWKGLRQHPLLFAVYYTTGAATSQGKPGGEKGGRFAALLRGKSTCKQFMKALDKLWETV